MSTSKFKNGIAKINRHLQLQEKTNRLIIRLENNDGDTFETELNLKDCEEIQLALDEWTNT